MLKNKAQFAISILIILVATFSTNALAQTKDHKKLLIVKIENEGSNLATPDEVLDFNAKELFYLRSLTQKKLEKDYVLISDQDKRDALELSVTVAKIHTPSGTLYIASSSIGYAKNKDDLFITHNLMVQTSIEKLADNISFQLSGLIFRVLTGEYK
jgi:hypothetical protein